jgi:phosphoribosylaminoimidazole-succinocarboxamide synthase
MAHKALRDEASTPDSFRVPYDGYTYIKFILSVFGAEWLTVLFDTDNFYVSVTMRTAHLAAFCKKSGRHFKSFAAVRTVDRYRAIGISLDQYAPLP